MICIHKADLRIPEDVGRLTTFYADLPYSGARDLIRYLMPLKESSMAFISGSRNKLNGNSL